MNITRKIEWDMGHRVGNHVSKCRNIHGHRYVAEITLSGDLIAEETSDEGMVMDFSDIKKIAQGWIDEKLDHGYMGHAQHDRGLLAIFNTEGFKVCAVPFVPTAENIAKYIFDSLNPLFEDKYKTGLALHSIKLWETPNCSVVYEPARK